VVRVGLHRSGQGVSEEVGRGKEKEGKEGKGKGRKGVHFTSLFTLVHLSLSFFHSSHLFTVVHFLSFFHSFTLIFTYSAFFSRADLLRFIGKRNVNDATNNLRDEIVFGFAFDKDQILSPRAA